MVNLVPSVLPITLRAYLQTFGLRVKNPLNFPSSNSSAIKPNGPYGPLVITVQTFAKFVFWQLKNSEFDDNSLLGITGLSKSAIIQNFGIFFTISWYLFLTKENRAIFSKVASSGWWFSWAYFSIIILRLYNGFLSAEKLWYPASMNLSNFQMGRVELSKSCHSASCGNSSHTWPTNLV